MESISGPLWASRSIERAKVSRDGSIVPGDIIVAVEGKPVDSVGKLLASFDDYKVGSTIRISVLRGADKIGHFRGLAARGVSLLIE